MITSLGSARLSAEVIGRSVRFTKRYLTTSPEPVRYIGTVSEDEDYIQEQWNIVGWDSGHWEARRSGEALIANLSTRVTKQVSLTS